MVVNNTPDANTELGKAAASIEEVFKYLEDLPDDKKHAAALGMSSNGLATAVPEINLLKSLGVNIQSPTPVGPPTGLPKPDVKKNEYNTFVAEFISATPPVANSNNAFIDLINSNTPLSDGAAAADEFMRALATAFPLSERDTNLHTSLSLIIDKPAVEGVITGKDKDATIIALQGLGSSLSTGGKKRTRKARKARKAKKSKKSKKRLPSKKRKARKSMRKH